ncbi:hypothetical protein CCUS01_01369 [Colletotrichum cuscutae]|uniref:Uncharacterized protein n=1 Tax=Colletotrichum cuscutae TaxID=1209917 RepID=A0AAI9UNH9_9PEZI|nr:hypothetical protein CCUS01_01369 [Colletotrichum cuscutae]
MPFYALRIITARPNSTGETTFSKTTYPRSSSVLVPRHFILQPISYHTRPKGFKSSLKGLLFRER